MRSRTASIAGCHSFLVIVAAAERYFSFGCRCAFSCGLTFLSVVLDDVAMRGKSKMTAAKSAAEGGFGRLLQLCVSGSGAMNSRLRLSHNSFAPLVLRLVSESQIAQTAILREILGV